MALIVVLLLGSSWLPLAFASTIQGLFCGDKPLITNQCGFDVEPGQELNILCQSHQYPRIEVLSSSENDTGTVHGLEERQSRAQKVNLFIIHQLTKNGAKFKPQKKLFL